ncbi:hypothetical protein SAURM35S_00072 [Streptomyces aurantiogriseus]
MGVETLGQRGVTAQRLHPALVGEFDDVGQRRVGERVGGGVGDRAGHVGDAVEDRVVDLEGRLGVGGGAGVLEAAALIDRDVDKDTSRLHPGDQLVGDQLRGLGARDENGADDEVGLEAGLLQLEGVGDDRLDLRTEDLVGFLELVDVLVEQGHVEAHADGDLRGVPAGDATADDHGPAGQHAGDAAGQHTAAAVGAHQVVGADLGGEPARDLGHRGEQRQCAAGQLDRLVGDRRGAGLQEGVRALLGGGQVQVGEERLVLAEAVVLLGDGLLDLQQQVGGGPHLVGGLQDLGTGGDVLVVRDRRTDTGVAFDDDLVAVAHQLVHAGRGDGHPELVVLDLAGDADLHVDHGPWLRGCGA